MVLSHSGGFLGWREEGWSVGASQSLVVGIGSLALLAILLVLTVLSEAAPTRGGALRLGTPVVTLALAALSLLLARMSSTEVAGAHEPSPKASEETATVGTGLSVARPMPAGSNGAVPPLGHGPQGGDDEGASAPEPARAGSGSTWRWIPLVAVGAVVTRQVLTARERRSGVPRPLGRDLTLALALAVSGVVHCLEAPSHWSEGWHLGIFFAASGAVLLGQAAAAATSASPSVYASVLATTLALVVLYVLARQVTLPLVDHRDPYLAHELPVKALELAVAGLSLRRLTQSTQLVVARAQ